MKFVSLGMKKANLTFIPPLYAKYINLVPEDMQLVSGLISSKNSLYALRDDILENKNLKYFSNKWTIKDVLQHNIDNERIQTYRALVLSRGDVNDLPGYNRELYAKYAHAEDRDTQALMKEFIIVRASTISLFESFSDDMLLRTGLCSGIKVSVASLGFLIIGHTIRHSNILTKRYFNTPKKTG